ncbi:hypothetical protein KAF81_32450 [Pseudomonas aeruginosa]|uniref:hypothetical protein n=1 Tax=Pseudomonas aeruginosa TaxID=287 RepID=UPI001B38C00C|nr:hypothetical protein [Pseudomonas aeruginosa]MBP8322355.1 hypothetical protein [Pseudomonas aeruginosa]
MWIIDEFVSQEGKWRYEGGMTYVNTTSDAYRGQTGGYVQISPTQFVPFTTAISTQHRQSDQLIGAAGIRYGLTPTTEAGIRLTGFWATSRNYDKNQALETKRSGSSFDSVDFSVTHRTYQNGGTSLFAFGYAGLISKVALAPQGEKNAFLQRGSLGVSAYATDDPVVFSLAATIGLSRSVNIEGRPYRHGAHYTLSPTISFLANERTTLSSGLQFSFVKASTYADRKLDIDRSRVQLTLGAGYAWDENISIYANYSADMSGIARTNSTQLHLIFSH